MNDVVALTAKNNNDAVSHRLLKKNTQKPSRTDDAAPFVCCKGGHWRAMAVSPEKCTQCFFYIHKK